MNAPGQPPNGIRMANPEPTLSDAIESREKTYEGSNCERQRNAKDGPCSQRTHELETVNTSEGCTFPEPATAALIVADHNSMRPSSKPTLNTCCGLQQDNNNNTMEK